ncbi:MAG: MarR family transcriptional regulator [Clostridia bacterium]|nr:MarR family transcriptional regulator [Clostridia bacterium]
MEQSLTSTQIQYLVAMSRLQTDGTVRPSVLARCLNVKKSSVHSMVKQLEARELVISQRYGSITITPDGHQLANRYCSKYNAIRDCLCQQLALDEELAGQSAMALLGGLEQQQLDAFCARVCPELAQSSCEGQTTV